MIYGLRKTLADRKYAKKKKFDQRQKQEGVSRNLLIKKKKSYSAILLCSKNNLGKFHANTLEMIKKK